jgi:hypothetical protein
MLVVQTDELAKMPEMAMVTATIEQFVQNSLDEMKLNGAKPPRVRLEAIDYIAYSMRRVTDEEAAKNPLLEIEGPSETMAICELAIRWVEPTNVQGWLTEHAPEAEAGTEGELKYVRVKVGDETGAAFYIAQRDANTLVATYSLERLQALVSGDGESNPASEPWQTLGSGVAELWLNLSALPEEVEDLLHGSPLEMFGARPSEGQPDPFAIARATLGEEAREICAGFDMNLGANQVGLRAALACKDEPAAQRVLASVSEYQHVAKAILEVYEKQLAAAPEALGSLDEMSRASADGMMMGLRMIAEASLEVQPSEEGRADVWVKMGSKLPESVLAVMRAGPAGVASGFRPVYSNDPARAAAESVGPATGSPAPAAVSAPKF